MSGGERTEGGRGILLAGVIIGFGGLVLPFFMNIPGFNGWIYLVASAAVSLELIDIACRVWFGRLARDAVPEVTAGIGSGRLRPFAVILSVRDLQAELDLVLPHLSRFKANTWFVDDQSNDQTALYLEAGGWHCLRLSVNLKKPGALKKLLASLPAEIETIVVLDPDAEPLNFAATGESDLEGAVRRFQAGNVAACCPRVRFIDGGILAAMQLVECEMAFGLGRKGLSPMCVTSGVSLYARADLERALDEHSLSVYAEDLENSLILIGRGKSIGYDDRLVFQSVPKCDLAGWFSQRVGWAFGLLRVYVSRFRDVGSAATRGPWPFYNFIFYMGFIAIIAAPIKFLGMAILVLCFANGIDALLALHLVPDFALSNPFYFASSYVASTALTASLILYLRPHASRANLLAVGAFYFFYSGLQAVPTFVGYLNWFALRFAGKRVYRDHYADRLGSEGARSWP